MGHRSQAVGVVDGRVACAGCGQRGMGVAGSDGSDGSDGGWRVFLSHTSELRNFPEKGSQASGSGGRELDEDTLARRRRVLGEDHPDTLLSANNLAADLRALSEADDDP